MTTRRSSGLSSSSGSSDGRFLAADFAKHLNRVLNRTVSPSRLSVVKVPDTDDRISLITRIVNGVAAPLELNRSKLLLDVRQRIEIGDGRPEWLAYSYRMQRGMEKNDWLVRWENHLSRPGSPYPRFHMHVNAEVEGFDLPKLHLATYRLPLESIIWTLIADFGVSPLDNAWQQILEESIAGYEERQRR